MIAPEWRRIAGLRVQPDGDMAAVWLAHDKETDTLHLYDACLFRREVMAVICEALNARGRWVPVAWADKAVSDELLKRGCTMTHEPHKETDAIAEVISRDIWERMRSGRFKVDKRLGEWLEEFKTYSRDGAKVPVSSHPLMTATRCAVGMLEYAKRQAPRRKKGGVHPQVAII